MVVLARLRWILDQLAAGRMAQITMNTYSNKVVVKVRLLPENGLLVQNGFAFLWLSSVLKDYTRQYLWTMATNPLIEFAISTFP